MKRQDTVLSSSSRRESTPEILHTKSIGCMSGIFQLLCKYQNRRKFLTFGKKHEKTVTSKSSSPLQGASPGHFRRFSCEIPRSPTLPAEIRHSNSVNSPESSPTPPALVVRLMGLDHGISSTPPTQESAAEKVRKLLQALEKCDQDLKALEKIIHTVKSTEVINQVCSEKEKMSLDELQPSPVSVLDEFTNSPLLCRGSYAKRHINGEIMQQKQRKKPGEEESMKINFMDKMMTETNETKMEREIWSNKVKIKSINEVCRDIAYGQKREIGRIGLALQDFICTDLIEETIRELGCSCIYSLPFDACKRKLCF